MDVIVRQLKEILDKTDLSKPDDRAGDALYVVLDDGNRQPVNRTETMKCSNGITLVLDLDREGRVRGIEFA